MTESSGRFAHLGRNALRRVGFELTQFPDGTMLWAHLARVVEHLDVNLVVDVGAHHGEYATAIRNNGYRGAIVSFEPVSSDFVILAARAAADPQWTTIQCALGGASESRPIGVAHQSVFNSFLTPTAYASEVFGDDPSMTRSEMVEIRRLDEIQASLPCSESGTRALLKIDTQGWDNEVLEGASGFLPSVVALQSEVSVKAVYEGTPSFSSSIELFNVLGFELSGLFPVTLDQNLAVVEFDCVAVRSK